MKELILDKWQEEILNTEGHILLCTGRQVGKTTLFARKAAERMLKRPEQKLIVVSLTEDQAQLMIIMILKYLEDHHKKYICKGSKKPTKNRIILTNKSQVIARPVGNTGDAVRGFTGDVLIVDEASRMPELMWTAAKPTLLTTGGEIWMCSTPFGKQGYFYECYLNKHNRFKVFHVNSEEVITNRPINDYWTEKRRIEAIRNLEEEKRDMSILQYAQEYLGQFVDELRQFFSDEWINKVCVEIKRHAIIKNRNYYLGVDIARMGEDDSTFEIIDKVNKDTLIHVESLVTRKTLTTDTEERIWQLNSLYNFKKIYIDAGAGSLGVGVFDHLFKDERTRFKVVAINNRTMSTERDGKGKQRLLKEDLYDNLKALGEKSQIKLLNDEQVRLSLKSVQEEYIVSTNQLTKRRIFGNYTHIAEGLIRAAYAAKEKNLNVWMKSIRV